MKGKYMRTLGVQECAGQDMMTLDAKTDTLKKGQYKKGKHMRALGGYKTGLNMNE